MARARASEKSHIVVLGIRIVAACCLVFALASPYILLPIKEQQIIFLVDRSASMNTTEQELTDFIVESLKEKKMTKQ